MFIANIQQMATSYSTPYQSQGGPSTGGMMSGTSGYSTGGGYSNGGGYPTSGSYSPMQQVTVQLHNFY